MSKVRIGVVGIGHLGNYHLQKYQKLPHTEIVAVADTVEERARKAALVYNCEAYTDYRKLIGTVDAVSITVPTGYHYLIAKDFLEAGADVLLEKPIATTLGQADELITIAEKKKTIFQIGFLERFNPAVVALKTVLGEPLFIEAHRLHPFFERGTDVDVILDLMIHDLDIIMNFVKSPIKHIDAVGVPVLSDKVDIANVRLVFSSGCVANITASRISNKVMQKIRFFGREGYHAVDYGKRELVSLGRKNSEGEQVKITPNQVEVKPLDPLEEEIRSFLKAVTDRTSPPVSGSEGRVSLELALRIIKEIQTAGEPVL
ncbi:MAG: Gfo/Idh/MocA family oxidoreductase [Syntrophales bacterium]|nr:Gfo/Idh/MocA family oxidoreductase [Syntrophales bacterium]